MEVCLKVLEHLEVSNKNSIQFEKFESLASQNDHVMKLSFTLDAENQEFILVKTPQNFDVSSSEYKKFEKNIIGPIFSIEYNDSYYAVFEGNFTQDYDFQDRFDFNDTVLILKTFVKFHGNHISTLLSSKQEDHMTTFLNFFKGCLQKLEQNFNGMKISNNLELYKSLFEKLLTNLETTLDRNYWVPCIGSHTKNLLFFKYGVDGKPLDFKILVLNSDMYVPPLYEILLHIFSQTSDENRKPYLHEFLEIYYNSLKKELNNKIFDFEQFYFQVRSFIPLIKLYKLIFYIEQKSIGTDYASSLKEMSEYLCCPRLLKEECYEILLNYLEHSKYTLQSYLLTPLEHRYGNLGDYFKFKAMISLEKEEKEINLFVKFLPSNNKFTNEAARNGPSMKEDFFYKFFVKEFKKCGLEQLLSFAPKCFLSKTNCVIVLEDLGLQGYRLITEQNYYTYEMLTLTVKKMARLHACSLIYEETKSKELKKQFRLDEYYGEYLQEIIFQTEKDDLLRVLSDVGEKAVYNYLIYLYPECVTNMTMEEFHRRCKITFNRFYPKVLKSNTFRNTLCHGDTWDTNIMFKFDSNNVPIDCKIVDFQMTRYCPPIQDVMSHLYLTTNRDTRTKFLNILLNEYYEELTNIVISFGFDMEKVLPEKEFWDSCYYMKSQGVCQALFYAPTNLATYDEREAVFSDPEQFDSILKKDRRPFIEEMIKRHPFYKVRLGEYIQDLYDICENEQY